MQPIVKAISKTTESAGRITLQVIGALVIVGVVKGVFDGIGEGIRSIRARKAEKKATQPAMAEDPAKEESPLTEESQPTITSEEK